MSSVAQERLVKLTKRFHADRLHHGLLFRGDNLLFLEQAARKLCQEILCIDNYTAEHPDLFHLRPTGKARIITVEKTRHLLNNLYRTGHQGSKKVAIIYEADRMRKEAANAFLKTLEEPPAGTYLLLLTTRPYSILPTIRSRTLLVRLEEPAKEENNEEVQANGGPTESLRHQTRARRRDRHICPLDLPPFPQFADHPRRRAPVHRLIRRCDLR